MSLGNSNTDIFDQISNLYNEMQNHYGEHDVHLTSIYMQWKIFRIKRKMKMQ
jgi:hypothetical protein